jgi:ubiquinone/menaquinone biosynthesis C-methylase UbiE
MDYQADSFQHQRQVSRHFKEQSRFWRNIYDQEDIYAVVHQLRMKIVLSWIDDLHLPRDSQVLEVGCGAGLTTLALAERGFAVTAMDPVQKMLDETRQAVSKVGFEDRVRLLPGDAQDLPLMDGAYSLVVALGVIPWLQCPGKALREMARVLQPGGRIVVSADNRWRLNYVLDPWKFPLLSPLRRRARHKLQEWGLLKSSEDRGLTTPHSLRKFDQLLHQARLNKERQMTFGFGPFTILNMPIFQNADGVSIHEQLQGLAERNFPLLRSAGCQYLVLAKNGSSLP